VGILVLILGSIHFLWQFALTGDALLNPYTLWWPYDVVGFGEEIGVIEGGHTLQQGWNNTLYSLYLTGFDLFGWGIVTWLLILLGLWAVRRQTKVWLMASVFLSLVMVYLVYWVSGPRYFYEGLYSLIILSGAGIAWLAGWLSRPDMASTRFIQFRKVVVPIVVVVALGITTVAFTPARLRQIQERYGFSQDVLKPFETPEVQELAPALVIVYTNDWKEYGRFLHLEDPYLTSPFIFAMSLLSEEITAELAASYPDRTILHYHPDEPRKFYLVSKP
jgi:hypothetical protein